MKLSKAKSEQAHDLTSLLERWSELEPRRCKIAGSHPTEFHVLYSGAPRGMWIHRPDEVVVQAAVQEAIEARSWAWRQEGFPTLGNYECEVRVGEHEFAAAVSDSPAVAFLSAYLNALADFPGETQ